MPILNMIAQGSGGGGGGSNVGEPTNISAFATSNTSIDIKWTDNNLQAIPPSTFQKSVLVRKVGSAPTTPSDGTTVVTETVMNTYQSSAYTDTGLTQGTTYYYQVFSYSTDGGITYGTPVSATPQKVIPAEYQKVEYIESSGTQRIDTGIKPTQDHGFECKFNLPVTSGDWNIMLTSDSGYHYRFGIGGYDNNDWQLGDGVTSMWDVVSFPSPQENKDFVSLYNVNNSKKWNLDGVDVYSFNATGTIPYSLTWNIFCQTLGSDTNLVRYGSFKLYYMKITDGTTLVRDFVPCYRKADLEIGLYDLVNDTFYTNDGTGTFTKGPDAN